MRISFEFEFDGGGVLKAGVYLGALYILYLMLELTLSHAESLTVGGLVP